MCQSPKLSIVIPIFNVDKYLAKTLDCVVNQSLKEIEIILIDDCSTDNSSTIIKQYQSRDNRIKVITLKNNQGSSIARNIGINISRSKYITFLDSDDIFSLDMLETMYDIAIEKNCSIVTCGFKEINEDNKIFFEYSCPEGKINKDQSLIRLPVVPWNKIYLKKLFDDTIFPENLLHQDYGTIPIILAKSDSIFHVNKCFVKHIVHTGSVTYKSLTKNDKNSYDVIINSKRLIENEYMLQFYESKKNIYPLITSGIVSKTQRYIVNNDLNGLIDYFNKVEEMLPSYAKEAKGVSINQKLFLMLFKFRAYKIYMLLMSKRNNHYTKS